MAKAKSKFFSALRALSEVKNTHFIFLSFLFIHVPFPFISISFLFLFNFACILVLFLHFLPFSFILLIFIIMFDIRSQNKKLLTFGTAHIFFFGLTNFRGLPFLFFFFSGLTTNFWRRIFFSFLTNF